MKLTDRQIDQIKSAVDQLIEGPYILIIPEFEDDQGVVGHHTVGSHLQPADVVRLLAHSIPDVLDDVLP